MHYRKASWILCLIGSNISFCCRDMLHILAHDDHGVSLTQSSVAATCPMKFNKLNSVRHVAGTNFAQIPCCMSEKVSAHTREYVATICPWNMSRKTFSQVCELCSLVLRQVPATHPCNMSPQCALNAILSPLHVAATYAIFTLTVQLQNCIPTDCSSICFEIVYCTIDWGNYTEIQQSWRWAVFRMV